MSSRLYRLMTRYYKQIFRNYTEDDFYRIARESLDDRYYSMNCYAVDLRECNLMNFRLGRTHNICFNDEKINFDIEVVSRVSFSGVYFSDEITLFAQCSMELDETIKNLKIEDVKTEIQTIRLLEDGVIASGELAPIIKKDELEREAEIFFKKFYPNGLELDGPVPIDYIAENVLGLVVLDNCTVSSDNNVLGQICFANNVVNGLQVKASTIVLNKPALDLRGKGCRQFTLAHELYHFWRHKYYLTLKNLVDGEELFFLDVSNKCDEEDKEKWLEWQADKVASRILMPSSAFTNRLVAYYGKYEFMTKNYNDETLYEISKAIARDYGVSRIAAAIRIKELNVFTDGMDVVNYQPEYTIIHFESSSNSITHYRHKSNNNTLYRYNVSKELVELASDNESISITREALNMLQEEDRYNDLIKEDLGATLKAIRDSKGYSPHFIAGEAGIDRNTVIAIEENLTQNIDVYNVVLICKALGLTAGLTKRLICKKLHDFENTMKDKMIEYCIDNFYVEDINSFKFKLDKAVSESKLIDESQRELRRAG